MRTRSRRRQQLGQAGMVSIMVTLILMMVISLIVVGFAEVSRRNSNEAVERQLSTQAYYAAETGINDALNGIKGTPPVLDLTSPAAVTYNSDCNAVINDLGNKNVLSATGSGVEYTCLLINDKPSTIPITVGLGAGKVVPLNITGSNGTLTLTWSNSASTSPSSCPNSSAAGAAIFKPNTAAEWGTCPYGVLQMDLYKDVGSTSSAGMAAAASTIYFVPTNNGNGATVTPVGAPDPTIVANADCNNATCTAAIRIPNGSSNYQARFSGIYENPGKVTINAGPNATFTGAGVIVDSTGKAQNVLRRVQVLVQPDNPTAVELPVNALQSQGGICKHFTIMPAAPGDSVSDLCDTISVAVSGASVAPPPPPPPNCAVPKDIIFAVDSSSSMQFSFTGPKGAGPTRLATVQQIVNSFIDNTDVGPTTNHEALVTWHQTATLNQDLTGDPALMHNAINSFTLGPWTVFTSGLQESHVVLNDAAVRSGSQKIVIFITDGGIDFGDTDAAATAAADVLKNTDNAEVFTIGIGDVVGNGPLLTAISGNGGYYSHADAPSDLTQTLTDISAGLGCG